MNVIGFMGLQEISKLNIATPCKLDNYDVKAKSIKKFF